MLESISTKAPKNVDEESTKKETAALIEKMKKLQDVLYAENKNSLLIVLQGMDASGKDSTVRHVFGDLNPMSIYVKSFKKPTIEEYSYDFLRRVHKHTPPKGMIHIFNRSHYEDVLVPEVHKTFKPDIIARRYDYINSFEAMLIDNNTHVMKFYLHMSRDEQVRRFQSRLVRPEKYWKYNPADIEESRSWDKYMAVYEKIFKKCSSKIPWIIVPADDKWYRNNIIATAVVKKLESLKMKYPKGFFDDEENRIKAKEALKDYKK